MTSFLCFTNSIYFLCTVPTVSPLPGLQPGETARFAAEDAAAGAGIGDGHGLAALAAYEGAVHFFRRDVLLMLPVHALAVRRAEFLPAVVFVGDEDNAAAAGAGEDAEDGSLSYFVRRSARLFPVSLAAARFGAEALRSPVRGEGPAAAGAYGLYVHRMPRSAGKKTRKKGRVKSSLRMVNPGPMEVPRYAVTVKDAAAGAKLCSLPPVCGLCADSVLLRGRLLYGRSS